MAVKTCTWAGCIAIAEHPQTAQDGEVWADLCTSHRDELERETDPVNSSPARLLRAWVYAQGGSKKATERMMK